MEKFFYIFSVITVLFTCFPQQNQAQENCTILKSNCPPSDLVPTCATTIVNGVYGAYVTWTQPSFSLSCPTGGSGYDFVMSYNLNESLSGNECWLYSRVQRTGTSEGQLRLWQSTQSNSNPNPNFTTPTFYLPETPVNCSMSITNGSRNDFSVNIYLIFPNGTMSPVNAVVPVSGSREYLFTVTPPHSGAYRFFFEFIGDGKNTDYLDLLKINAPLFGTACTGDINFSITSNHVPGEFFPVGRTTVIYTAICNSCIPVISETCQFDVVVNGVTATAVATNATCDLDNGTVTLNAVTSNTTPALQYNLNNSGWTNFTSPETITGLAPGNYTLNVRDYFPNISGYCQILNPISFTINRDPDLQNPVITCPANVLLQGCDLSALSVTGLPFSPTPQVITLQQFSSSGATATDNCQVVFWQYQDTSTGTCPLIVTRTYTVKDARGNTSSCSQIITIRDTQFPSFTITSREFCVTDLDFSTINVPKTDIVSRPDWYIIRKGSAELDISDYHDNCTAEADLVFHWRIDFADGTALSGNGQVSAYGSDIRVPGQENQNTVHQITYWVTDQCGNVQQQSASITIHPRPQINKQII